MAKKQQKVADNFVFFDVTYEDGTRSSRRLCHPHPVSS